MSIHKVLTKYNNNIIEMQFPILIASKTGWEQLLKKTVPSLKC